MGQHAFDLGTAMANWPTVLGPIAGAGLPGLILCGRWPSRLVATAAENRLLMPTHPRPGRRAINSVGPLLHADAPPQGTQEGEMIEFLAQMPTDTMIFLTMAVVALATMLMVLKRLI
jgi:hypothetical protein